jgi:hypothetical protein
LRSDGAAASVVRVNRANEAEPEDGDAETFDDRSARELDDVEDREELRSRYYGLLQELRVVLPGVQVLVAFLLTVPFAGGFDDLDTFEKDLFAVTLMSAMLSVVAFIGPTAFHRVGARKARSFRLQTAIWQARCGLALLAVSLIAALLLVSRFVFGEPAAWILTSFLVLAILAMWLLVPLRSRNR